MQKDTCSHLPNSKLDPLVNHKPQIARSSSTYLRVKVIPKSHKTELVEILNEDIDGIKVKTYKIRLKAAPEKGKANDELIKFLSEMFDIPRANIRIVSGKTDRIKLVKISN